MPAPHTSRLQPEWTDSLYAATLLSRKLIILILIYATSVAILPYIHGLSKRWLDKNDKNKAGADETAEKSETLREFVHQLWWGVDGDASKDKHFNYYNDDLNEFIVVYNDWFWITYHVFQ